MNRIFVCYSKPLKDFLYQNGLQYDITGTNTSTSRQFFAYVRDEKLNSLLDSWRLAKPM